MSCELINRISIKKDGVYVSTHSNNDTSPYHSVKVDFLTEAYRKAGQKELDKEMINMFFYNADYRGNHKSIIPYSRAFEKVMRDKEFLEIRKKYNELHNKAFHIANRFDEYKKLSKEEANKLYEEIKPEVEKARNLRNEYVAKIVGEERKKINGPKEIAEGIYEIIPVHKVSEGLGEIYSEYMNFNTNNGTVIYEKRLGFLPQCPDIERISEYEKKISKFGVNEIDGAKEYEKFIKKYPDIYNQGVETELRNKEISEISYDLNLNLHQIKEIDLSKEQLDGEIVTFTKDTNSFLNIALIENDKKFYLESYLLNDKTMQIKYLECNLIDLNKVNTDDRLKLIMNDEFDSINRFYNKHISAFIEEIKNTITDEMEDAI